MNTRYSILIQILSYSLILLVFQQGWIPNVYAENCLACSNLSKLPNAPIEQMQPYCDASDLAHTDLYLDTGSMILSFIVVGVCLKACLMSETTPAWFYACMATSASSDLYAIASKATLTAEGNSAAGNLSDLFIGTSVVTGGLALGSLGSDILALVLHSRLTSKYELARVNPVDNSIEMDADNLTSGKQLTPEEIRDGKARYNETRRQQLDKKMSCVAATLAGLTAASTIVDMGFDGTIFKTECNHAFCLRSHSPGATPVPGSCSRDQPRRSTLAWLDSLNLTSTYARADGMNSNYGATHDKSLEKINYLKSIYPEDSDHDALIRSYLTKETPIPKEFGGIGALISQLPNSASFATAMDKLGISVEHIENEFLVKNTPPLEILKQIADVPDEIIEKLSEYVGNAESSPPPTVTEMLDLAMGTKTSAIALDEVLGQKSRAPANVGPANYTVDIWHTAWKDSIFDLISERINVLQKAMRVR